MSPALLLAAALETALNRYLRLDEEALARAAALAGKTVAVEVTGLNLTFYLLPGPGGVQVLERYSGAPDALIRGAPFTLARLVGRSGSRDAVGQIEIEGDTQLALALQKLLADVDLDAEERASRWLGDTAARKLGLALRGLRTRVDRTRDTLLSDIAEYLQEESRDLPSRISVDRFLDEVDEVRSDIDRLQARIARLQQRLRRGADDAS